MNELAASTQQAPFEPSPDAPEEASWQGVERLTAEFHQQVLDPAAVTSAQIEALQARLQGLKASFGGRLLCPYLRPNFLTRSQVDYVASSIRAVMGAIRAVEQQALRNPAFFERMGLTEAEQALVAIEPGLQRFSYKSRMDTFLSRAGLHFVEYNAESPAGIGYGDALQEAFWSFEPTAALASRYPLTRLPSKHRVLDTLLGCWREWGGQDQPTILITDYDFVPTVTEFEMFRDYFEAQGYRTIIADPRALDLHDGRLWAEGVAIDLVYRRVLVNELIERLDDCKPLVEAVKQRLVCMVNPFRAKLLHKKLLFAMLWSDDIAGLLTPEQRLAVRRHVPWTARVQEGRVTYDGQAADLSEVVLKHQHRLVLKPNDEYGGKGVVLGWEVTPAQWQATLQAALEQPHVVQERVPVARLDFPDLERNLAPRTVDLDPFIFGDEVSGFLTRLSDTSLCNVTSGGGQVPTFVLEGA